MSRVVDLLCELVRYPTHHAATAEAAGDELALCQHVAPLLRAAGADEVEVVACPRTSGHPGAYVFARWGTPRTVVNAHVDTVPANSGWSHDPWTPVVADGRLGGLGSADTKGAIAAAIVALDHHRPRDLGLLFSGDEERGTAAVRAFLASRHAAAVERVIVCEPSGRKAGVAHRGVLAYHARVRGHGGHSSRADHHPAPIVTMARLAVALFELGVAHRDRGPDGMRGLCLNVAGVDGGVAFNVIPDQAGLSYSIRPAPGFDRAGWEQLVAAAAAAIDPMIAIACEVDHEPFGGGADRGLAALIGPHVEGLVALDFWTEAALYQAAGKAAIVVGPGDIGCAHAADEAVPIADLDWAVAMFADVYARVAAEAARG
ncbi:MAG: M20/M25/M40 family metallo-hydrolase [Myxococcales bacterium]|nr:M20/M25/M40 family metallo-hydrolase [Myxococcales bacterium]